MEIPGAGSLTLDEDLGWYYSEPVEAGTLGGATGRLVLTWDFEAEDGAAAVHAAVADFLSADRSVLEDARTEVFAYYREVADQARRHGWGQELPDIPGPEQVWDHVQIGDEFQAVLGDDGATVHVTWSASAPGTPSTVCSSSFRGAGSARSGPATGTWTERRSGGQPPSGSR